MPAPQRRTDTGVIGHLLAAPQRFEFFQAVRLVEQWRPGSARFRNRLALGFPPNQIENMGADDNSVRITPAFIGLLGSQGVLPLHYSERIHRHERDHGDGGPRAFLDLFSHRPVQMFHQAWAIHRPESQGFLQVLTALAGAPPGAIARETLARYAMQLRSRTVSASVLAGMYSEYFGVPVALAQLTGEWSDLPPADQAQLGRANAGLDGGMMLGARMYACDARAALHIGPLDAQRYEDFLPGRPGARQLSAMLQLHCGAGMTWEVHLIQRADDLRGIQLGGASRLGVNARLLSEPATQDRSELMYLLHS